MQTQARRIDVLDPSRLIEQRQGDRSRVAWRA
jgi:hypothetical protein